VQKGNSYGKREEFLQEFFGQQGGGEHGSLKATIVGMCSGCFGAIECMRVRLCEIDYPRVRLCEINYPTSNVLVVVCFFLQLKYLESLKIGISSELVLDPWREMEGPRDFSCEWIMKRHCLLWIPSLVDF